MLRINTFYFLKNKIINIKSKLLALKYIKKCFLNNIKNAIKGFNIKN